MRFSIGICVLGLMVLAQPTWAETGASGCAPSTVDPLAATAQFNSVVASVILPAGACPSLDQSAATGPAPVADPVVLPVIAADTDLKARRDVIDAQMAQLDAKQAALDAASAKLDERSSLLTGLQAQATSALAGQYAIAEPQLGQLVSLYQTMKPVDAAREMEGLPDNVLIPLSQAMSARKFAAVLAKMSTKGAAALTSKLNPNTTIAFELPK